MTEQSLDNLIFALDIGTRSVIGIAGRLENGIFNVLSTEREEYKARVVVDGQIEDIAKTAEVAGEVKLRIEKKLGVQLKNVYIAAAGRALRTVEVGMEAASNMEPITEEFVSKLEFAATERAYAKMADAEQPFFCVGHAVKAYMLDGYRMSSIIDHKGKSAQVHIIATFLPAEVVESLYSAMRRIGLSVAGLTLEPIAAMNAVIPPDLRKLNIALCDIGAGTSDIALCEGGSISGYTMATIAGDEITEAVMNACLTDFETAEQIKRQLGEDYVLPVVFYDIFGTENCLSGETVLEKIEDVIKNLAATICERILECNGRAPAAAFLVGGGSQTPLLRSLIAKGLGMDDNRVAIGGGAQMGKQISCELDICLPDYATPLGIALTAAYKYSGDSFVVTINGRKLRLFSAWDTTVLGILQLGGYHYSQIMGRSGSNIVYTQNGERKTCYGSVATPAQIMLNGESASLSAAVALGDRIDFTPTQNGEDASIVLSQLLGDFGDFEVTLCGKQCRAGAWGIINGKEAGGDAAIENGDDVRIHCVLTVAQLLAMHGYIGPVALSGKLAVPSLRLEEGMELTPYDGKEVIPDDEASAVQQQEPICITLNGRPVLLPPKADGTPYQFFDLLSLTDIDPRNPQGNIVQLLNGSAISYLTVLKDGDTADIYWKTTK